MDEVKSTLKVDAVVIRGEEFSLRLKCIDEENCEVGEDDNEAKLVIENSKWGVEAEDTRYPPLKLFLISIAACVGTVLNALIKGDDRINKDVDKILLHLELDRTKEP